MESTKGKVIGIGGVFFKSQDPEKTKQWYEDHLGIENGPYGHITRMVKPKGKPYGHHLKRTLIILAIMI